MFKISRIFTPMPYKETFFSQSFLYKMWHKFTGNVVTRLGYREYLKYYPWAEVLKKRFTGNAEITARDS